jgi:hypothetical protein
LDLFESLSASGEFGYDGVDSSGPNEGLGVLIPDTEELLNRCDEIGHAEEGTAANPLIGQFGKPTLDQVQPTATGGHEVRDKTRVSVEPRFDLYRAMSAVVVHHQMQRSLARELTVNTTEKL